MFSTNLSSIQHTVETLARLPQHRTPNHCHPERAASATASTTAAVVVTTELCQFLGRHKILPRPPQSSETTRVDQHESVVSIRVGGHSICVRAAAVGHVPLQTVYPSHRLPMSVRSGAESLMHSPIRYLHPLDTPLAVYGFMEGIN
ncbi:hypothetical protein J6590_047615 [Homalodisca vitripennis]|nr:hypothetical protein J6590_047615 [Homalodisca vitripennis]